MFEESVANDLKHFSFYLTLILYVKIKCKPRADTEIEKLSSKSKELNTDIDLRRLPGSIYKFHSLFVVFCYLNLFCTNIKSDFFSNYFLFTFHRLICLRIISLRLDLGLLPMQN